MPEGLALVRALVGLDWTPIDTLRLAEREGWHSLTYWHRRFGYSPDKAVAPRPPSKTSARFNRLIAFVALAALLLVAWATR